MPNASDCQSDHAVAIPQDYGLALEPDVLLKWWLGHLLFNSEDTCPYVLVNWDTMR